MKICIIAPKAYQLFNQSVESTFGGAEVQLYLLATELKAQGHEIDVVTADYGQKPVETYDGVRVKKSFSFEQAILKRFLILFRIMRQSKVDVYIQRTLTPFAATAAVYGALIRKKTVYMVAHDGEVNGTHSIYSSLFGRISAWIAFRLSSLVVTQNDFQQKKLSEKKRVNSICIRSGYPLQDKTKHVEKTIDVLWVGRAERWKNPTTFLELAAVFPDKQFTIIAPPATAEPDYASDIQKQASVLPNVNYIAYVPFAEVQEYFDRARVFINTSDVEGFPNTFIQAALAAVPVLSLNVNPDNVLIGNDAIGMYAGGNKEQLKKNVERLLNDNALYDQFSIQARKYAEKHHDIKKTAATLIEAIS